MLTVTKGNLRVDSSPAVEVLQRAAAVATVTKAMCSGSWPCDTESLDALRDLLAVAARWQLVAETVA
jgi:hypothetical protein